MRSKILLLLLIFSIGILIVNASSARAGWSDDPLYRRPFPVPEVPPGAVLVIYGPLPLGRMGKDGEKLEDWKKLLSEAGVGFPAKGFALFYRPARILVVATDELNQEMVKVMME